jgi:hypothetical protein
MIASWFITFIAYWKTWSPSSKATRARPAGLLKNASFFALDFLAALQLGLLLRFQLLRGGLRRLHLGVLPQWHGVLARLAVSTDSR